MSFLMILMSVLVIIITVLVILMSLLVILIPILVKIMSDYACANVVLGNTTVCLGNSNSSNTGFI